MESALNSPSTGPEKRRPHRARRPQLLTRDLIDGRTNAAKVFDRLTSTIETDLGGRDQLSAIELALVSAFAGAAVTLENLNTRLLLGEEIDLNQARLGSFGHGARSHLALAYNDAHAMSLTSIP